MTLLTNLLIVDKQLNKIQSVQSVQPDRMQSTFPFYYKKMQIPLLKYLHFQFPITSEILFQISISVQAGAVVG